MERAVFLIETSSHKNIVKADFWIDEYYES